MNILKQKSPKVENTGQALKVFDRQDPFTERKGRKGRKFDRGDSQSRSKSRTISPKRRINVNNEVPKTASRLDILHLQQPALPQWTVQTSR